MTLAAADADIRRPHGARAAYLRLRIYSSDDVTGVEVGGAVKNVIAIAAGISDGLGFGESARAALITRGLAEITRLGCGWAARAETFMGLSGVGDLILTCTGNLSRNRQVGLRSGGGQPLPDILRRARPRRGRRAQRAEKCVKLARDVSCRDAHRRSRVRGADEASRAAGGGRSAAVARSQARARPGL